MDMITRATYFNRIRRLRAGLRIAIVNADMNRVYAIDKALNQVLDNLELNLVFADLS